MFPSVYKWHDKKTAINHPTIVDAKKLISFVDKELSAGNKRILGKVEKLLIETLIRQREGQGWITNRYKSIQSDRRVADIVSAISKSKLGGDYFAMAMAIALKDPATYNNEDYSSRMQKTMKGGHANMPKRAEGHKHRRLQIEAGR